MPDGAPPSEVDLIQLKGFNRGFTSDFWVLPSFTIYRSQFSLAASAAGHAPFVLDSSAVILGVVGELLGFWAKFGDRPRGRSLAFDGKGARCSST